MKFYDYSKAWAYQHAHGGTLVHSGYNFWEVI